MLLLGNGGGDQKAGMIRVDGSLRKLLDINSKVGKDLIQLVACGVCRMSVWDGVLEASCTKPGLHVRPLLVEVSGDFELAARQLR